jgi:hypothetical protein
MTGAIPPWRGAQLKHRENFTFTLSFRVNIFTGKNVIINICNF